MVLGKVGYIVFSLVDIVSTTPIILNHTRHPPFKYHHRTTYAALQPPQPSYRRGPVNQVKITSRRRRVTRQDVASLLMHGKVSLTRW
jgi:hypothetical protein